MPCLCILLALLVSGCGSGHSAATPTPATSSGSGGGPTVFGTDVLTYHNDAMRSGQDLTENVLTPQNVGVMTFGKLRILAADGAVDAAPLVVSGLMVGGTQHNVLYVASEHDSLFAYDADTGALLAKTSLLGSSESPSEPVNGCGQVSPEIGITATPVIDRSAGPNGTLFVVAMSRDAGGHYYQRLHALDLLTLADRLPAQSVQASAPGNGPNSAGGQLQFDSRQYKERAALLLLNSRIYLTFASHCDIDPYNGWIMSYDEATLAQSAVLQLTPNGTRGSIWDAGGIAADGSGNVYATVANGTFDTVLNAQGFPQQGDFGNAAIKLATGGAGPTITDFFTMFNTVTESDDDVDLGSGSVLLLMDQTDNAGQVHHLLVVGGKDGYLYVLNRDHMGGFNAGANQIWQQITLGGALFSAPVYFNDSVYVADAGGTLKAFRFANATLPASPSSQTAATFAYPGTSPAVSANGSANAIVWALESSQGAPAVLHAYDAANLGQEYYNSAQAAAGRDSFGNGNKFITPVIANGKVFIGTPSGVAVFGLL
jgi:hypothetical protein